MHFIYQNWWNSIYVRIFVNKSCRNVLLEFLSCILAEYSTDILSATQKLLKAFQKFLQKFSNPSRNSTWIFYAIQLCILVPCHLVESNLDVCRLAEKEMVILSYYGPDLCISITWNNSIWFKDGNISDDHFGSWNDTQSFSAPLNVFDHISANWRSTKRHPVKR